MDKLQFLHLCHLRIIVCLFNKFWSLDFFVNHFVYLRLIFVVFVVLVIISTSIKCCLGACVKCSRHDST